MRSESSATKSARSAPTCVDSTRANTRAIKLGMRKLALVAFVLVACNSPKEPPPVTTQPSSAQTGAQLAMQTSGLVDPSARAEVGKPAPDFALKDLDGNDVRLSSFKGKAVVLEWFNPGC